MGDMDTDLDAFRHLPYFKPLYTTILRQQMQYLTEQLSRHAGEESLVLTTNLSTGTISSLTSTYGVGFLESRSDIKKQFIIHCSNNKIKQEGKLKTRTSSFEGHVPNDHVHISPKRKRCSNNLQETEITGASMQPGCLTSVQETSTAQENGKGNAYQKSVNCCVSNIGIEDVRSLSPWEDDLVNVSQTKGDAGQAASSKSQKALCENEIVIEQEPTADITMARNTKEHGHTTSSEDNQENVIVITVGGSHASQRYAEGDGNSTHGDYSETETKDEKVDLSNLGDTDANSSTGNVVYRADAGEKYVVVENNRDIDEMEIHDDSKTTEISAIPNLSNLFNASSGPSSSGFGATQINQNKKLLPLAPAPPCMYLERDLPVYVEPSTLIDPTKYDCRFCNRRFTAFSSRKRHERKHTGETPWACQHCDKKFYRKDDLNAHYLKHIGQTKQHICPVCEVGFYKKARLEAHVQVCHANIML